MPTITNCACVQAMNIIPPISTKDGYKLSADLPPLSVTGFADDQAVTSKSEGGAIRLIELVESRLSTIGLDVNPSKSMAIRVRKGMLRPGTLKLSNGEEIKCIDIHTKIKYLGCTFTNLLVWDSTIVGKITEQLNNLIKSPLLRKDQKLIILNQYIMPQLTYPLQAAPRNKIPKGDLHTLDVAIRTTIKAIIGLPTSTATSMIYAPRKYRGIGAVCLQWEVLLQHFSMASRLSRVQDSILQASYDFEEEKRQCQQELGVSGNTAKEMRQQLRKKAFQDWSNCDWQGIGVKHFSTYPQANKHMTSTSTLSSSEWTAAIKLATNYAPLAGVPGAPGAESRSSKLCRRCRQDNETPKHVLGGCDFGALRRNLRHDAVKHKLSSLLMQKGFHVIEEARCEDDHRTSRRVDVLAFDKRTKRAYLVDPTVRFETNDDMDRLVQQEKASIYDRCIPDLARRYTQYGDFQYETIGLWFGARGVISSSVLDFWNKFGLDKKLLPDIAESILAASVRMLHHHIYST